MRKVALILILSLIFAVPTVALAQQASAEQAAEWNKQLLDYYEDKYGASEDFKRQYVTLKDWTIVDVDSSELEAEAQEEITQKEAELADAKQQVAELQEQHDYFASLSESMEDEDYKEQIEPVLIETERSLNDAKSEVEGLENEIQNLAEQDYLSQVAVTRVDIKFGGNVAGTMTHREEQFINPETGETVDAATAKEYNEVSELLNEQPFEQQQFHHETVGLFLLAIGLGGWWLVNRKL